MSRRLSRCVSIGADLIGVRKAFCDSCHISPDERFTRICPSDGFLTVLFGVAGSVDLTL
jgi:hypothetical protein